ncbi:hypothetical protein [Algiphilus sp.]|uniref:hypothetical protein n=1 Tax=Algiphilus sp. TaxID=1872431 RepID=UPI0025C4B1CD|nr:hypothetical protein [Algiphilus sp.]MCK5770912.1 hypothetical protein [Algiphilus sp.]
MARDRGDTRPATDRQRDYATKLGLTFPEDITLGEMSQLLDSRLEGDRRAKPEHFRWANAFGVSYTRFMGKRALFYAIIDAADESGARDLCRWFAFRVCRDQQRRASVPLIKQPDGSALRTIAAALADDERTVRSIERAAETDPFIWWGTFTTDDGRIIEGGSRNTIAYKAAANLIRQEGLLHERPPPDAHPRKPEARPTPATDNDGWVLDRTARIDRATAPPKRARRKPTPVSSETRGRRRDRMIVVGIGVLAIFYLIFLL